MRPDNTATESKLRVMAWPASGANPYQNLLYRDMPDVEIVEFDGGWMLREEAFDILHVHWPEEIFWRSRGFRQSALRAYHTIKNIYLAKRGGTKVVWTVHNLAPHGFSWRRAFAWCWYWPLFLRMVDAHISLSEAGQCAVLQKYPRLRNRPGFVIPHGHYRPAYTRSATRAEARTRLGISQDASVVLFFGLVREYKNVVALVRCFRGLGNDDLVLIIAGRPIPATMKEVVQEAAAGDRRVALNLRFIDDEEVQYFFAASDLVVLPFGEMLNSGSILLALSFDKPVLCPAKGALVELQALVGEDWIMTYDGELTTRDLSQALDWAGKSRAETAPLADLDWPPLARQTVDVYMYCRNFGEASNLSDAVRNES